MPENVAATFNAPVIPPMAVALSSVMTPVFLSDVSTANAPMVPNIPPIVLMLAVLFTAAALVNVCVLPEAKALAA